MIDQLIAYGPLLLHGAVFVLLGFVVGLWLISVAMKDSSIVDIFWGPGCAGVAWVYYFSTSVPSPRALLALGLITLWGARLGLYIGVRNWGSEDRRYARLRQHITDQGRNYTLYSLRAVFGYQGAAMLLCTLPMLFAIGTPGPIGPIAMVGAILALAGLGVETLADQQMSRFRAGRQDPRAVMDQGLWRYSRHPNYFGEMLVQWGLFILALDAGALALLSVVAPLLLSYLITGPMGASLLERRLVKKNPDYGEYVARTSAFIPWLPK